MCEDVECRDWDDQYGLDRRKADGDETVGERGALGTVRERSENGQGTVRKRSGNGGRRTTASLRRTGH